MYEAVAAYPAGESTVSRQAKTAATYGYDGVVVRTQAAEFDPEAISDRFGVDVVRGVEIVADDPQQAAGAVGNERRNCTVLLVAGGTDALNRYAVETDLIDVLTRPMAGEGDINHVLSRAAKRHNVYLEFDFGAVLRNSGGPRVQAIKRLRKLRELVEQYEAPYVVSVGADSHLQLRGPRELKAVGNQLGFTAEQIETGLAAWGEIAARNRKRNSDAFIELGVWEGRHDA